MRSEGQRPRRWLSGALGGLVLAAVACAEPTPDQYLTQSAIVRFREQHGGFGQQEPWTARVEVDRDGSWVVREYRDLSTSILSRRLDPGDADRGIEWRGTVVVSYQSRIVDASNWRGPDLPTYWDVYAEGYPAVRIGGRVVLEP